METNTRAKKVMNGMRECTKCQRRFFHDQFDRDKASKGELVCLFCVKESRQAILNEQLGKPKPKKANTKLKKREKKKRAKLKALPPPLSGTTYHERNLTLSELGFRSYKNYLQSALWNKIRRRVFATKGNRCFLCQEQANQLHHARYHRDDLTGTTIENIHPICEDCHRDVEYSDGEKLDMESANKKLQVHQSQFAELVKFLDGA